MAFTDEQKLLFSKQALKKKIMEIELWSDFTSLIQNITSNQLKNLIKNALLIEKQKEEAEAAESTINATNYQSLYNEVNNL